MTVDAGQLTPAQRRLVDLPPAGRVFLEGPAGTGKTTAAAQRLLRLLELGVPGETILVLTPQRALSAPYEAALRRSNRAGGGAAVWTAGGLAQRMVDLFWPLAAAPAGFAGPDQPPVFLNLETAQYFMAHLARPLLEEQRLFDSLVIERNRLFSQVLDNLNKAALVGFPHTEIAARLKGAWMGEPGQLRIYDDVQTCADLFRSFCLANNLLDFSLQVEVFRRHLWDQPVCRDYLRRTYRHLIADNIEEDSPFAHDLLGEWLPELDSALLIYDCDAGYRRFLGADPLTAGALCDLCEQGLVFDQSLVTSPQVDGLALALERALLGRRHPAEGIDPAVAAESAAQDGAPSDASAGDPPTPPGEPALPAERTTPRLPWTGGAEVFPWKDGFGGQVDFYIPSAASGGAPENRQTALWYAYHRFYPQMLDWVADQVAELVHVRRLPPGEIVVLAPFLSDSLRYALMERLARRGVPYRSHRPSRSLRDEPAARCLLTLAALAHPTWRMPISKYDVAYALVQAIDGMDLVRAQLLTEIVYRPRSRLAPGEIDLAPFTRILADVQQRITYRLGERYERLRSWLLDAAALDATALDPAAVDPELAQPLDYFFSRLFGEVLSQPGFGFHASFDAGRVTANLIDSARSFRWVAGDLLKAAGVSIGGEYLQMVQDGVIAAQYAYNWQAPEEQSVLLAPAYTFLLNNRPAAVQFWLDAGSRSWSERLYQPLTHPYVLTRQWPAGRAWNDADELAAGRQAMTRLVLGLLRRCRQSLYLGMSELGEGGYEQRGPLLLALQRVLKDFSA